MIWKMIGRWALVTVAVPLVAAGAKKVSDRMEARRGRTRASRLLRSGADVLHRLGGRKTHRRRFW